MSELLQSPRSSQAASPPPSWNEPWQQHHIAAAWHTRVVQAWLLQPARVASAHWPTFWSQRCVPYPSLLMNALDHKGLPTHLAAVWDRMVTDADR